MEALSMEIKREYKKALKSLDRGKVVTVPFITGKVEMEKVGFSYVLWKNDKRIGTGRKKVFQMIEMAVKCGYNI